jgi:geranylgeranyl reductase family protein
MAWDLRTEALVVGAGPAGGMAALELARRGIGVVVVDRSPFPRDKVCGDGLLEASLGILGAAGLEPVLQRRVHRLDRVRFSAPDGREFLLDGSFATLRRRELDGLLVEEACRAGAQFVDGIRVTEPLLQGDACVGVKGVDRSGRFLTVAAKIILLATGANARMLAAFGVLEEKRPTAYGIRGYFRVPELGDEREMLIAYDRAFLPFYVWFFPMGGGVFNVGWGMRPDGRGGIPKDKCPAPLMRRSPRVATIMAGSSQESPLRAAPMRTGFRGARSSAAGLLVLGEALGLSFPFLGEGIGNALISGRLAAQVAARALGAGDVSLSSLCEYERELRALLYPRHQGYLAAERWFRCSWVPNLVISRAAGSPALGRLTGEILRGRRGAARIFSLQGMLRLLLRRYGPWGG